MVRHGITTERFREQPAICLKYSYGKLHGKQVEHHTNGITKKVWHMMHDKNHGLMDEWDEQGNHLYTSMYTEGIEVWSKDGEIWAKEKLAKGLKPREQ